MSERFGQTPTTTRRLFLRQLSLLAVGLAVACAPAEPARTSKPAEPTAPSATTAPAAKSAAATSAPAATGAPAATAAPAAKTAPAGKVTVAISSDVLTLDPSKDTSPISLNVFKNVYDQLTDIRRDGSVGPQLTESWDSPDGVTWTFKIRGDAKFHDGKSVTVDDIIWTYQTIMQDAKSPVQAYMTAIDRIEKVDDRTVRFVTKYPYAPFPRQVSLISILPRAAYEAAGPEQFARTPIGSGPYKVVSWAKDDQLVLEGFDQYFAGAPRVKNVVFRPVPSESSRVAGLEAGDLDIVALLPPPEVPRLQQASGLRVELLESNRNLFIGMNVTSKPLDDVKVRQAIDMAINREQICTELLGGLGKPVGQPVASAVFGFDPSLPPTKYDPERAKQLVREAGYANGLEVEMRYPTNRYAFGNEVVQAIAGQLSTVGINLKLEGMEYAAFFPLWTGKKFQGLYLFAFGPSIMDADLPLGSLYESSGRGYWDSPEIDALVKKQRGEVDEKQRQATIHEIWKLSAQNVPISWIYTEVQSYGIRDRVDWKPRTDERFTMTEAALKG